MRSRSDHRCSLARMLALTAVAAAAAALAGCAPQGTATPGTESALLGEAEARTGRKVYLAPTGSDYDLVTPSGIHVKTNGQYKTEAERRSAAAAIDRYWREVRKCTIEVIPPGDNTIAETLLPEFPGHLAIEIASNWQIVEGAVTHRRQQAFPSLTRPGAFSTATREEEALYVKVVPELNGLGRQMAGEVNLWLSGSTSALPTDLSNVCAALPCYRFAYDNSPSQAWENCSE